MKKKKKKKKQKRKRKRKKEKEKKKKRKEKEKEKNGVFSGHYVIASSLPPERRPLERRTLVPKTKKNSIVDVVLRFIDAQ